MSFTVRQLPRAEADVDAILTWLVERHAHAGALAWLNAYEQALDILKTLPARHSLAPENDAVETLRYGTSSSGLVTAAPTAVSSLLPAPRYAYSASEGLVRHRLIRPTYSCWAAATVAGSTNASRSSLRCRSENTSPTAFHSSSTRSWPFGPGLSDGRLSP